MTNGQDNKGNGMNIENNDNGNGMHGKQNKRPNARGGGEEKQIGAIERTKKGALGSNRAIDYRRRE